MVAPGDQLADQTDAGSFTAEYVSGFQISGAEHGFTIIALRPRYKRDLDGSLAAKIEPALTFSMSHVTAKDFLKTLGKAISDFEAQTFKIPDIGQPERT